MSYIVTKLYAATNYDPSISRTRKYIPYIESMLSFTWLLDRMPGVRYTSKYPSFNQLLLIKDNDINGHVKKSCPGRCRSNDISFYEIDGCRNNDISFY